ncbi:MAG: hypothetical protein ACFE8V_15030 [Promethearchaeota archaeon]
MGKRGTFGKALSIIGAIVGLASILLSFIAPELFAWYRYYVSGFGSSGGYYLTGFGTVVSIPPSSFITQLAILETIGGSLVILGSILCIVATVKKSKGMGALGGLLMLLAPVLLVIDFLVGMSEFAGVIADNTELFITRNWFWEDFFALLYHYIWGVWTGFFMGIAGGALGLIGGIAL